MTRYTIHYDYMLIRCKTQKMCIHYCALLHIVCTLFTSKWSRDRRHCCFNRWMRTLTHTHGASSPKWYRTCHSYQMCSPARYTRTPNAYLCLFVCWWNSFSFSSANAKYNSFFFILLASVRSLHFSHRIFFGHTTKNEKRNENIYFAWISRKT